MCHREVCRQLSLTNIREIFLLTSKIRTIMQLKETRNQGFFRAGDFSWNESTLINILSTIHQKKASRENFFLLNALTTAFQMRHLHMEGHNQFIFP